MSNEAFIPGQFPSAADPGPAWRVPVPRVRFQHVLWKHVLLFLLTLATTTLVGAGRGRVEMLAVRDIPRSGKPSELLEAHGISASAIVRAVRALG